MSTYEQSLSLRPDLRDNTAEQPVLTEVVDSISAEHLEIAGDVFEVIKNLDEQLAVRFRGLRSSSPTPCKIPLRGLNIDPTMELDTRLQAIQDNALIYDDVLERVRRNKLMLHDVPGTMIYGEENGQSYRGVLWLIDRDLGILEQYPIDEDGNPTAIKPYAIVSRDAMYMYLSQPKFEE